MKGAVWAILGLTLLQAALSGRTNTGRIGQLGQGIADVLSYVIDPDKPAIPDLRATSTTKTSPSSSSSSSTTRATTTTTSTTSTVAAPTPLPTVSANSSSNYLHTA